MIQLLASNRETVPMILIVDDDQSFRDMAEAALGAANTRTARTILEGLQIAASDQPRFIVLDHWFVRSPYDGIDAVPAFLAVAPRAHVVIWTVDKDRGDVLRALEAGASAFVQKGDLMDLWRTLVELADLPPALIPPSSPMPPEVPATPDEVPSLAAGGRRLH